jgi:predicted Zn-dependent protease
MTDTPDSRFPPEPQPGDDERLAARLAEASSLAEDGRWGEAFDLLREEEADHPDDATLLCMLGVTARESGVRTIAYDYFRRCLAQDPVDPVVLTTAGQAIAEWDDADAERVLRLAAMTAPGLASARLNYGAYLTREGLFDAALPELEAARDLEPDDVAIRWELGVAFFLSGRAAAGLDELEVAVQGSPDDSWMQAVYGLALVVAGRFEEAAEQLHAASTARAEDWEIHVAAALAAAGEEWEDEAWAAISRADLAPGADDAVIREAEELVEEGAEAAREFLRDELAAPVLRERLLSRG